MKTRKRKGGYSPTKLVEFETLAEFASYTQQEYARHAGMPRWRIQAAAARKLATTYLRSKGIPSSGYMFKGPGDSSWTDMPPAWWPRLDPDGMAAAAGWRWISFDQYIEFESSDSRAKLSVRLLEVTAAMDEVAANDNVNALVHWSIELGKAMALFQVYTITNSGNKRGRQKKPWQDYADHLVRRYPDQTKDIIWRHIPIESYSEGHKEGQWWIKRAPDDAGLFARTDPLGAWSDKITRGHFFKNFLRTRGGHKN